MKPATPSDKDTKAAKPSPRVGTGAIHPTTPTPKGGVRPNGPPGNSAGSPQNGKSPASKPKPPAPDGQGPRGPLERAHPRLASIAAGGTPLRESPGQVDDPAAVRAIQIALRDLGFSMPKSFPDRPASQVPDGIYGNETFQAVRAFQRNAFPHDQSQWDGRVGQNTLKHLSIAWSRPAIPADPGDPEETPCKSPEAVPFWNHLRKVWTDPFTEWPERMENASNLAETAFKRLSNTLGMMIYTAMTRLANVCVMPARWMNLDRQVVVRVSQWFVLTRGSGFVRWTSVLIQNRIVVSKIIAFRIRHQLVPYLPVSGSRLISMISARESALRYAKFAQRASNLMLPIGAFFSLKEVYEKHRYGSPEWYQAHGAAGLAIVGGLVGERVGERLLLTLVPRVLAALAMSGALSTVVAFLMPVVLPILFASVFVLLGIGMYMLTQPRDPSCNSPEGTGNTREETGGTPEATGKKRKKRKQDLGPTNNVFFPWWPPRPPPVPVRDDDGGKRSPSVASDDGGDDGGHPPPPGAAAPPVGGVLFQNCDTVLTGIGRLTGAYWDRETNSVVLIGEPSGTATTGRRGALPSMDADHLAVALRAAILGEPLGVSIDAPTQYRHGNDDQALPPNGTAFLVSYLGGCAGTLTGAIFFEADRILKCLSLGRHNETGRPFRANVPGYRSTFDLYRGRTTGDASWHRFWFVVERVELRRSADTGGITFDDVRIAVRTEIEVRGSPKGIVADPSDVQFAEHLTSHYDDYAREFPVFERLKELAKVSAIASFLVAEDLDLDLDFAEILGTRPVPVAAPQTTPSLLRSETSQEGTTLRTHSMSGGVDLRIASRIREDIDGAAKRLCERARSERIGISPEWKFGLDKDSYLAKAIPLRPPAAFRPIETDHRFPPIDGLPSLALQRVYESKRDAAATFGPGWTIFIPWSLRVVRGLGKRPETMDPAHASDARDAHTALALRSGRNHKTAIYHFLGGPAADAESCWRRVASRDETNGSFIYDPADVIRWREGRFVFEDRGRTHFFDGAGRLVEVCSSVGCLARYVWDGDRLARIENASGQRYELEYAKGTPEVQAIRTANGETVNYVYDRNHLLVGVRIGGREIARYGYDISSRLAEIVDAAGVVTQHVIYDAAGTVSTDIGTDTVDPIGTGPITRILAHDRLTTLVDGSGTRAELIYAPKGNLHALVVRNRSGLRWRLEYANDRTLRRFVDTSGRATEFAYDDKGRVRFVRLPGRREANVTRDDHGRIIHASSSGDRPIDSGHANRSISGLDVIGTRFGTRFRTDGRFHSMTWESTDEGEPLRSGHDPQMGSPWRHRTRKMASVDGHLLALDGPAGTVYVRARDGLVADVTFQAFRSSR